VIDPIVIKFSSAGVPEVKAAFEQVAAQTRKFDEIATRESQRGGRARVAGAKTEAQEKERAHARLVKDTERLERQRTKEEERESKRRDALHRRSSEMAGRYAAQQAREEIAVAKEATREIERLEEQKMRIRIRSSEMAGRAAEREANQEIRNATRSARANARSLGGALRGGGTLGRMAGGLASIGGAAVGIGGAMFVADAGRQQMAAQTAAAAFINSATTGGKQPNFSIADVVGQAGAVAGETGMNKADVIGGAQNFVKLAGADQADAAMKNMRFFAKLSTATGASMQDITGAAGIIQAQNKSLKPADMRQMLLDVMEQGKQGAVEISDLAKDAGTLGSTRNAFAGNMGQNQRTLMALAQIAKPETGGSGGEEAAMSIKHLAEDAQKAATGGKRGATAPAWLKKLFNDRGQMESPMALIEATLTNTKGNPLEIGKIFKERGKKLFAGIGGTYRDAYDAAGGDHNVPKAREAGLAAVRAQMAPIVGATGSEKQLDQMFAEMMSTPGEKFRVALEQIETVLGNDLTPALEAFATHLSDPETQKSIKGFIDGVAGIAKYLAENPFKGIGEIVLLAVTADIAKAAIGQAIGAAILRMMGGSAGAAGVPGGGGLGGAAVNVAGAAVVVGALMNPVGSTKTADAVANVTADTRALREGTVKPEDMAVQQHKAALLSRKAELEKEAAHPTNAPLGEGVAKLASMPFDALGFDTFKNQLKTVTASLAALEEQAKRTTPAVGAIPPVKSTAPPVPIPARPNM
jgi:hypothetical protein